MFEPVAVALVARELKKRDLIHSARPHGDGAPWRDRRTTSSRRRASQVVVPISTPLKATGGLVDPHGNLAPDGCVVKMAGQIACTIAGRRACSTARRTAFAAVRPIDQAGDVVVIRYEGPTAAPACGRCCR